MKTSILFFLLICFSRWSYGQSRALVFKAYTIDAVIPAGADSAGIAVTCEVERSGTASVAQVLLSSDAKIHAIEGSAAGLWHELPFRFVGRDTLELGLPEAFSSTTQLSVRFTYAFPVGALGDSLLLLDRGNRWYPLIPDQIAALKLRCSVPNGYMVLSAGDLRKQETSDGMSRFFWESPVPVFKVPLVVFRSGSLRKTSVPMLDQALDIYSASADTAALGSITAEAKKAFMFYSDLLGPYPRQRLTIVEVPYFDGVNVGSGLLEAGSSTLRDAGRGNFEPLHLTIAEQWIGAAVYARFRQPGFWFLTISLPHYLRLMYVRHSEGEKAFRDALHEPLKRYEEFAGKEKDVPILDVDFPNTREKGLVLYAKGPLVVSRLHQLLGDEQWKAVLRDLYRVHLGKIMTYDEFRSCMSQHDGSGRVIPVLDRMMTGKGMPEEVTTR